MFQAKCIKIVLASLVIMILTACSGGSSDNDSSFGSKNSSGSYNINGTVKNNVSVKINLNKNSELQLNLGEDSELIQIGTGYTSKVDLDNDLAFNNGMIILSNKNCTLLYALVEKNGFEYGNIDNISISITSNGDGSYTFTSTGSYNTGNYTVSEIHGANVGFDNVNGNGTSSGSPAC